MCCKRGDYEVSNYYGYFSCKKIINPTLTGIAKYYLVLSGEKIAVAKVSDTYLLLITTSLQSVVVVKPV